MPGREDVQISHCHTHTELLWENPGQPRLEELTVVSKPGSGLTPVSSPRECRHPHGHRAGQALCPQPGTQGQDFSWLHLLWWAAWNRADPKSWLCWEPPGAAPRDPHSQNLSPFPAECPSLLPCALVTAGLCPLVPSLSWLLPVPCSSLLSGLRHPSSLPEHCLHTAHCIPDFLPNNLCPVPSRSLPAQNELALPLLFVILL